MSPRLFLITAFALTIPFFAFGSTGIHPRLDLGFVHPRDAETGGQAGLGVFVFPIPQQSLEIGPRASVERATRDGVNRKSWSLGLEGHLWMMNLMGPGLQADWVSAEDVGGISNDHYRLEPLVDLRLMHLGSDGAVAVRIGAPYEQQVRWGFEAGLTFQLSGVSSAASLSD